MKRTVFIVAVAGVLFSSVASLLAAPAMNIQRPPLSSKTGFPTMVGPTNLDPGATQGQWFKTIGEEIYESRAFEFYDNIPGYGGGQMGALAIEGYVVPASIVWAGQPGASNILAFDIAATITNDLPGVPTEAALGENAHGEQITMQDVQWVEAPVTMLDVKLTAEFAIDAAINLQQLPGMIGPYGIVEPPIRAANADQLAWYCWSEDWQDEPAGDFYVPAFDFGDIAPGQSSSRLLQFTVEGQGLPQDLFGRWNAVYQSAENERDILLNRTTSLKISQWIDLVAIDTGAAYPLGALKSSDVSVFFNVIPEPATPTLLVFGGLVLFLSRRRRGK